MSSNLPPLRGPNIILCEGTHDKSFILHLLRRHAINGYEVLIPNELEGRGGHTRFAEALTSYKVDSGFSNIDGIIIVRDSDTNIATALTQTQTAVREAGPPYRIPAGVREKTSGRPAVGVLLIPWDNVLGNLETLLLGAVTNGTLLRNLHAVETYLTNTGAVGNWPLTKLSKARIRCLIAGSHHADPDLGISMIWDDYPSLVSIGSQKFQDIARYFRQFPTMPQI